MSSIDAHRPPPFPTGGLPRDDGRGEGNKESTIDVEDIWVYAFEEGQIQEAITSLFDIAILIGLSLFTETFTLFVGPHAVDTRGAAGDGGASEFMDQCNPVNEGISVFGWVDMRTVEK